MRSTTTILSNILLRLDHASVQLDEIDGAIRKGDSAAADAALKDYIKDLTDFRTELVALRITTREHGVISRVLDQLESQLSRLERMKPHVRAGNSASVSEPLAQVKAALRMVHDKVIQGQK